MKIKCPSCKRMIAIESGVTDMDNRPIFVYHAISKKRGAPECFHSYRSPKVQS
jgi:hypothetical protein